jgi:hypothetical protein
MQEAASWHQTHLSSSGTTGSAPPPHCPSRWLSQSPSFWRISQLFSGPQLCHDFKPLHMIPCTSSPALVLPHLDCSCEHSRGQPAGTEARHNLGVAVRRSHLHEATRIRRPIRQQYGQEANKQRCVLHLPAVGTDRVGSFWLQCCSVSGVALHLLHHLPPQHLHQVLLRRRILYPPHHRAQPLLGPFQAILPPF